MNATFAEPEKSDYEWLASRWVSTRNLIKEEWGYEINQSTEDLQYLQRVIDRQLIEFNDRYACECIGVAFGRVVANNIADLDWWVVQDAFGRALTIRYGQTTLQYNVIHMIMKRLPEGIKPDLASLFAWITEHKEELKSKVT